MKYVVIDKVVLKNSERISGVYAPLLANIAWEYLGVDYDKLSINEQVRIKRQVDRVFLGETSSDCIFKKIESDGSIEREIWITK